MSIVLHNHRSEHGKGDEEKLANYRQHSSYRYLLFNLAYRISIISLSAVNVITYYY